MDVRTVAGLALALLVVTAGCSGFSDGGAETPETSVTDGTTTAPETTEPSPTTTPPDDEGGDADPGTGNGDSDQGSGALADPPSDRLGWEAGVWHNESIAVDNSDGVNESERQAAVARAMARIEYVRGLEFEETVPIEIITRAEYRNRSASDPTETFRAFDNAKFEALFFVGEDRDSLEVQKENRGSNVLGYFSPTNDSIVLISDSGQPQFDGEGTLAHELTHAIQDQKWNLSTIRSGTRDGYNGQNGLIEGEANLVQDRYMARCGDEWECIDAPESGGNSGGDLHYGIYFMNFFPYSDGVPFVATLEAQGGWEAVNDAFASPPASAEQVIYPEKYGQDEPTNVSLTDTLSGDWERVRPDPQREGGLRPAYATLGQSALSAMFAHTFSSGYPGESNDFNSSTVISPREFLNYEGGGINSTDPLNYDLAYTNGWEGDRLHVYRNAGTDEGAYVWRLVWESPEEAQEFAEGYRALVSHWGGSAVEGRANTYRVSEESPFTDAFYVSVEGDTVTVVNAPTVEDLPDVYADYPA